MTTQTTDRHRAQGDTGPAPGGQSLERRVQLLLKHILLVAIN